MTVANVTMKIVAACALVACAFGAPAKLEKFDGVAQEGDPVSRIIRYPAPLPNRAIPAMTSEAESAGFIAASHKLEQSGPAILSLVGQVRQAFDQAMQPSTMAFPALGGDQVGTENKRSPES